MSCLKSSRFILFGALALILVPLTGLAANLDPMASEGPVALTLGAKVLDQVPVIDTGEVDVFALRSDLLPGEAPQFADPLETLVTPETDGVWADIDAGYQLWQLRVSAPGALSLNFGFTDFELPAGARLTIYPADLTDIQDPRGVRVFTDLDNRDHRELWTPVVLGDDVILELLMPAESRADYSLELTRINRGFRFLGEDVDKSGSCNIDVVCPEGDDWWSEINSVGVYTINGIWYCTGVVVNNTAQDGTPYFLTANHCNISTSNDQAVIIYWNFQSPECGQQGGGSLAQHSNGVTYLASNSTSDFCLVEINNPLDPAFNVTFSGWDRSGDDYPGAVAVHHPSCDEKSISFEYDSTTTTSYLGTSVPGNGTHVRVSDWDLGTTEPGSSGSPLYSPEHRIIGQLHGGYAACSNDLSDWYGKFSVTWPYLDQWLDPLNTGAMTLDTFVPYATAVDDEAGNLPAAGLSLGNYPNPFNPVTRVQFNLEAAGHASLTVYDIQGRRVRELVDGPLTEGEHTAIWDGTDDRGRRVGSGLYFARLSSGGQVAEHKMVLLK
jgi:lysyl endopeptidase